MRCRSFPSNSGKRSTPNSRFRDWVSPRDSSPPTARRNFFFALSDGEHIETVAIPEGIASHALHFVAGGLRAAMLVLRDWCDGFFAQSQSL